MSNRKRPTRSELRARRAEAAAAEQTPQQRVVFISCQVTSDADVGSLVNAILAQGGTSVSVSVAPPDVRP